MIQIFAKALAYRFQLRKKTQVLKSIQGICNLNGTWLHNRIIKYFHTILYHFSAMSLLEGPFSRSLKAWHFLPKLFTLRFHLNEDMLLERCWKKERTNFRIKFCQCSYKNSNTWNEQYDSFENLIRMFEIAEKKQPKNDWRDWENCSTRWKFEISNGAKLRMLKGPNKKLNKVKVRDSGCSR